MKLLFVSSIFIIATAISGRAQTTDTTVAKDSVFTLVEKEAKFPGGLEGWIAYLRGNLKGQLASKYIKLKLFQKEASQTAIVQFIVNEKGHVSDVQVVNPNEVHPKLAAEAIRVIKQGPEWDPATQNDKPVMYQARQRITFSVSRE